MDPRGEMGWVRDGDDRWHGNRESLTGSHQANKPGRMGSSTWLTLSDRSLEKVRIQHKVHICTHPHVSQSTWVPWRGRSLKENGKMFSLRGLVPLPWPFLPRDGHFQWEKEPEETEPEETELGNKYCLWGEKKNPSAMGSEAEPREPFAETWRCQQRQGWWWESHSWKGGRQGSGAQSIWSKPTNDGKKWKTGKLVKMISLKSQLTKPTGISF